MKHKSQNSICANKKKKVSKKLNGSNIIASKIECPRCLIHIPVRSGLSSSKVLYGHMGRCNGFSSSNATQIGSLEHDGSCFFEDNETSDEIVTISNIINFTKSKQNKARLHIWPSFSDADQRHKGRS